MNNPFESLDKRLANIEGITLEVFKRVNSPGNINAPEKIYTKSEAAKFLSITEPTLSGYISDRKVPFCKPTEGKVYFLHSDLIDWLKKHRTATLEEAAEAYQQPTRHTRLACRRDDATLACKAV